VNILGAIRPVFNKAPWVENSLGGTVENRDILTGQAGLMKALDLRLPAPPVRSVVGRGMRRSVIEDGGILERVSPLATGRRAG